MFQMLLVGLRHPRQHARYHHKGNNEQRNDVETGNNPKLTKHHDVGRQQREEADGNSKIGEECGKTHFQNNSTNGFGLILSLYKLEMVFIEKINGIRDTDGYDNGRDETAEQADLVTEYRDGSH